MNVKSCVSGAEATYNDKQVAVCCDACYSCAHAGQSIEITITGTTYDPSDCGNVYGGDSYGGPTTINGTFILNQSANCRYTGYMGWFVIDVFVGATSTFVHIDICQAINTSIAGGNGSGDTGTLYEGPSSVGAYSITRSATGTTPRPNVGACCLSDGTCSEMTEAKCLAAGGTFRGLCTTCMSAPVCETTTGATCFDDGTCEEITLAEALERGGNYLGDGTTCSGGSPVDGACPSDMCCNPGVWAVTFAGLTDDGGLCACTDVVDALAYIESQEWECVASGDDGTWCSWTAGAVWTGPTPNGCQYAITVTLQIKKAIVVAVGPAVARIIVTMDVYSGTPNAGCPTFPVFLFNGSRNYPGDDRCDDSIISNNTAVANNCADAGSAAYEAVI